MCVTSLQQQQCGEGAAQAAVTVLEGMYLQEHHDKHGDDQQGVQVLLVPLQPDPVDQLGHEPRRVEGRGGLEHDADLLALLVPAFERLHGNVEQKTLDLPVAQLAALDRVDEPMLSMVATRRRAVRA